ncbi:hypothetical protein WA158_000536 [Blastocystis sp. Blastoise]
MKFRAVIKFEFFDVFAGVIAAQSKLSDKLCFMLENGCIKICAMRPDRSFSSYCDIKNVCVIHISVINIKKDLFDNYIIQSKDKNKISFEISGSNLMKVINGIKNIKGLILKLTVRDGQSCLTFEISMIDISHLKQDIPIQLLSGQDTDAYREPQTIPPKAYLDIYYFNYYFMYYHRYFYYLKLRLSSLQELREVLGRMRITEDTIYITATSNGLLEVMSRNQSVEMKTSFNNIQVLKGEEEETESDITSIYIRIDRKSLSDALICINMVPKVVLLCFNDQAMIILVILRNNLGTLTYYIPGHILVDGEDY